jgi:hypothetical protein
MRKSQKWKLKLKAKILGRKKDNVKGNKQHGQIQL